MKNILLFISIITFFSTESISAQKTDSTWVNSYKNTVRLSLTPFVIVGPKSFVVGYERILKNNQSFSINVGYLQSKPATNKNGQPLNLFDQSKRNGFAINADYRFYFNKRNPKPAPDGLYWGPYTAYYQLNFNGKSVVTDGDGIESTVGLSSKLQLQSLGAQLGYQFLFFNDRFSVDLILMGPSLTRYIFDLGVDGGVEFDPDSDYYEDLKDILEFLMPGSGIILEGQQFTQKGNLGFTHLGFRYGIQIGYRF